MAVVKANAYGHGAVETTRTLLRAGADSCAVATLGEAWNCATAASKRRFSSSATRRPTQAADALQRNATLDRLRSRDGHCLRHGRHAGRAAACAFTSRSTQA